MLKARLAFIAMAALLASPGAVFAGGGKINWTKWKTAKAQAAATGMPILVYAITNEKGGGC